MVEPKDRWDKSEIASKVVAALLIPAIAGIYTLQAAGRESRRQETELLMELVEDCVAHPGNAQEYINAVGHYGLSQDEISRLTERFVREPNEDDSRANVVAANAEIAANPGSVTAKAIEKAFSDTSPRVYIHMADNGQRRMAERIASTLRSKGYLVPGIINMNGKVPNRSQLRYFKSADESGAKELISLLESQGGLQKIDEQDLTEEYGAVTRIQPKHFELWLAKELRDTPNTSGAADG